MDWSWMIEGLPWEAVIQTGDEHRVVVDVWSSCNDLAIELHVNDRYTAEVHGPFGDDHRMATTVSFYREIYQAGVNAGGVENRTKEAIARWVETLAKDNIFKIDDRAQLDAMADGIREERFASERDVMLTEAINKCARQHQLLRPIVVPARSKLRVTARLAGDRVDIMQPVALPPDTRVRVRCLKTAEIR